MRNMLLYNIMSGQFSKNPDFEYYERLDAILSTPLTPENISSFGDIALEKTIELVEEATNSYQRQPTVEFESKAEQEEAAARYFKLRAIDEVLDNLIKKSAQISSLDQLIGRATLTNGIIVPPDQLTRGRNKENGFKPKNTLDRLKATLFILQNDFGVDVNDQEQMTLTKGEVTDKITRGESYYSVNAPLLKRTILVCDEEGNVSYVFNSDLLSHEGLSEEIIINFTKSELNELLVSNPSLGQRVIYSQYFVSNMRRAINDPNDKLSKKSVKEDGYLYPEAPEDVLSAFSLANLLGITPSSEYYEFLKELKDQLGVVNKYRFNTVATYGYTQEQQELIRDKLAEKGLLVQPAPEGILCCSDIAQSFGIDRTVVARALKRLDDQLGNVKEYKFTKNKVTRHTAGYTPEQQKLIRDDLEKRGAFAEQSPEEVLSAKGIGDRLGVANGTVDRAVIKLKDKLSDAKDYKFNGVTTKGYNVEQQAIIIHALEEQGVFAEQAPEEVLSAKGIADRLGVANGTVDRTVLKLKGQLGNIKKYKFGARYTAGYSQEQQELIRQYLTR